MVSISTDQVKWMEDSINLQLRNFTVLLGRHFSLSNEDILHYIEPISFEVGKRQRKPAKENRCIARLVRGNTWEQCSHKYSCGQLCKTHAKMKSLKYGTIHEPVPEEFQGKYKENSAVTKESDELHRTADSSFRSVLSGSYSDLSLYPQSKKHLEEIEIAGRLYLQDRVTACLYTHDIKNPVYIGRGIDDCIIR